LFGAQEASSSHGNVLVHKTPVQSAAFVTDEVQANKIPIRRSTQAEGSSQPASVHVSSCTQHVPVHVFSNSQPITTERVPEVNRLKWWFYGSKKQQEDGPGGEQ
jgi:hypothetical protein